MLSCRHESDLMIVISRSVFDISVVDNLEFQGHVIVAEDLTSSISTFIMYDSYRRLTARFLKTNTKRKM